MLEPFFISNSTQDKAATSLYLIDDKFTDFSKVNWTELNIDKESTLVFFDDNHQSGLKRTLQAWDAGEII